MNDARQLEQLLQAAGADAFEGALLDRPPAGAGPLSEQLAQLLHAARRGREGLEVLADWLTEQGDFVGPALRAALNDEDLEPLGVAPTAEGTPLPRFASRSLLAGQLPGAVPCVTFALLPAPGLTGRVLHGPAAWPVRVGAPVLIGTAPLDGAQVAALLPAMRSAWGTALQPRAVEWRQATDVVERLGLRVCDDVEWSMALHGGLVGGTVDDLEWAAPSVLDPSAGPVVRALREPFLDRIPRQARVRLARDLLPRTDHVDLGLDVVADRFCRVIQRAYVGFRGAVTPATTFGMLDRTTQAPAREDVYTALERAFGFRIPDELVLGVLGGRLTVGGWIGDLRRQIAAQTGAR